MKPEIIQFNQDASGAEFKLGCQEGKWGIVNDSNERPAWPFVLIWVAVAPRANCPDKYFFKFQLDNYPSAAPVICIWNNEKDCSLEPENRPKGTPDFSRIFRSDWHGMQHLYIPYERFALGSHHDWPSQYPNLYWKPTDTINKIVNDLHHRLNSSDYHGK